VNRPRSYSLSVSSDVYRLRLAADKLVSIYAPDRMRDLTAPRVRPFPIAKGKHGSLESGASTSSFRRIIVG
jgi:hypothetical protein